MAMSQLARELHRAAAQRGHLEPVFQDLSDQFTRSMQRLYPVWLLVGPGLSDPGHIELASRTIYLDSEELLGPAEQIAAGQIERRAILRTFGVALHETFHAKHTKRWSADRTVTLEVSDDPDEQTLGRDRRLLEEPRMEAHGVRDQPAGSRRDRFVRAAMQTVVVDVLVGRFLREVLGRLHAGRPVSRDLAGTALTYLHARTLYGAADPADIAAVVELGRSVLGEQDFTALEALYQDLIWVVDGDNDTLDAYARRYRDIIGPPDPDPDPDADGGAGQPADGAAPAGAGQPSASNGDGDDSAAGPPSASNGDGDDSAAGQPGHDDSQPTDAGRAGDNRGDGPTGSQPGTPDVRSLSDTIADAQQAARRRQLAQFDEDVSLRDLVDRAASPATSNEKRAQVGTGAPTGRIPDRGVNRPPLPDEIAQARRYADELRRALVAGSIRIDKRTPGGRFNARAYVRSQFERAHGLPATSRPWEIRRDITRPVQEPHVGLIVDTSGSMAHYEHALGPICWILSEGLRAVDGRLAIALFGNGMELLSDGTRPLKQVPGIRTGGGTAFGGDAIVEVSRHLEIASPRRPRLIYIVSDGGWWDTQSGVEQIARLRAHGVPVLHISIGIAPLSVDADRISVITDPADALGIVRRDTVDALHQTSRQPARR